MTGKDLDDDNYVANLLKQDAQKSAKQYKMVGLDALVPNRPRSNAPKPNMRFLNNLIRDTDNHNSALLAKEAKESKARLRRMNREPRESGRLTPPNVSEEEEGYRKRKRQWRDDDDREERKRRHARYRDSEEESEQESRRSRHRNRRRKHEDEEPRSSRRKHTSTRSGDEHDSSEGESEHEKRSRHGEERVRRRERNHDPSSSSRRKHTSHKSSRHEGSPPRPRSRSRDKTHRRSRRRHRSRSGERLHRERSQDKRNHSRHDRNLDSESDPLEDIVGPLPPRPASPVRARGRGAHKANDMDMDARFSSTYDPKVDVQLDADVEDEWGDALEALRDRQRWKQQGAERLKAAGFSDEQVKKWETGGEKGEDDVRWASKGEGREWDRGKVLDADGQVQVKADWGRLT